MGAGAVELVEIPSGRESNDNIVAFWRPAQGLQAGHPASFAYRLTWLAEPALPKGLGDVVATRSGASLDGRHRVFILDIVGAGRAARRAARRSGRLGREDFERLAGRRIARLHGLRARFEVDPSNAELIELRLRILRGDAPVTETWLYRWTST